MNLQEISELYEIRDFLKSRISRVEEIAKRQESHYWGLYPKHCAEGEFELNGDLLANVNTFKNCIKRIIDLKL